MKKFAAFEAMNPLDRRRFLKRLGIVLASPLIPAHIRFGANEILLGSNAAYAATAGTPTYFIEINLRDQFDLTHVFVPPSLANPNVPRGGVRGFPLFDDPNTLVSAGNRFFVANEGRELIPHLDSVACIDLCEMPIGNTHGHEAANATRSPGRSYNRGSGMTEMNTYEQFREQGNEFLWSATPTPAVLHNYYQKTISPGLRNGIIYKGVFRGEHTCYHHAANLPAQRRGATPCSR